MIVESKYKARKVRLADGTVFDSKKEYNRWCELKLLERAGKISDLKRQERFYLVPAQYELVQRYGKTGKRLKDGKKCIEGSVAYVADFVYKDENGHTVVEDTKGVRTPDYIIKRKLMLFVYGIRIQEV